ncbi:hypothetical protein ACFSRY_15445 [Pontibacter locisalis]|uniref:Phospholipase_D-nuclease N-terminal n=1 Tax=Pontibacter locisalis TaxID=1719035 RepID=A0ABW5INX0_9BACT
METTLLNIPNILLFALAGLYLLLLVFMLVWVYHDAELRGVNGWFLMAITFFSGTVSGILAWLIFRPKLKPQPVPVKNN